MYRQKTTTVKLTTNQYPPEVLGANPVFFRLDESQFEPKREWLRVVAYGIGAIAATGVLGFVCGYVYFKL